MSKKKNKFDLTSLVHDGCVKDGETIAFVSDPSKNAKVTKCPNGEYKLTIGNGKVVEIITVHAFAQRCLGQDPPDHASKWFKTPSGKTLYELWHQDDEAYAA